MATEILKVIQPLAIDAALEAAEEAGNGRVIARVPWNWNWSRPVTRRAWQHAVMRLSIPTIAS